jgi:hypothetical protein
VIFPIAVTVITLGEDFPTMSLTEWSDIAGERGQGLTDFAGSQTPLLDITICGRNCRCAYPVRGRSAGSGAVRYV